MKFSVGRLKRTNGGKGLEVFGDAGINYPLKDFRYEVQVGYRTITCKIIGRKRKKFQKRFNHNMFKEIRKNTFGERQVN